MRRNLHSTMWQIASHRGWWDDALDQRVAIAALANRAAIIVVVVVIVVGLSIAPSIKANSTHLQTPSALE